LDLHSHDWCLVARGLVAAHPQPNENAWLIGQALMNAGLLPTQLVMGMVGARGFEPTIPTCRIVVPGWIAESLQVVA
jgi:hypothetical protein